VSARGATRSPTSSRSRAVRRRRQERAAPTRGSLHATEGRRAGADRLVTNSSAAGTPWRASRHRRGMPVGGDACALRSSSGRWPTAPNRRRRHGRPPRRTSGPGHPLPPGSVTGAACAELGRCSTARVPGRELGFGGVHCGRRGLPSAGRPGAEARRGRGRRGETTERRRSRRVCAEPRRVRRRSGALTPLRLVPRDARAADRCRGGERGHRDGRASVTCAGAHDPKPQCRVGRLTECPACAGRGDTSSTDDPIRKRHQDL
jgi:hypothetical protein